jgi:hypothetical protein
MALKLSSLDGKVQSEMTSKCSYWVKSDKMASYLPLEDSMTLR